MKRILSAFVNLLYPRPEGEEWKWGEIILVLGMIGFLVFIYIKTMR
jgi:hypothetical protein